MKIKLAPGTHISFNSRVYELAYQDLLYCPPDCTWDHDCYEEPHVGLRVIEGTSLPLSQIGSVFDLPGDYGRPFNHDTEVDHEQGAV